MAAARPQLVFLAGPQQDDRVVLVNDLVVIGRSASADVRVAEKYVSREQMRLTLTPQGWVAENLTDRAMRINGKKYRPNKKILLATGDLIGLGVLTEMLFVGPGDDPEETVSAFRRSHVIPPVARPSSAEAEVVARPETPQPAAATKQPEPPKAQEPSSEPKTEQIETDKERRKTKLRKYAIMFSVYALVLLALILWLSGRRGGDKGLTGEPPVLTDDQIADAFAGRLEWPTNDAKARLKLTEAVFYYNVWKEGDMYLCFKRFKEHLAYSGSSTFKDVKHAEMYHEIRRKVIVAVQGQYRKAFISEKEGKWRKALRAFDLLLRMVPEEKEQQRDEEVCKLVANFREHVAYINRCAGAGAEERE
jgi:hypothetical protein